MSSPAPENVQAVNEVQAAIAEAESARTITAFGETFRVADKIGLMALVKYAEMAKRGATTTDIEGLVVMGQVISGTLYDDAEYARFQEAAIVARADDGDLMEIVKQAIAVMSARPTMRPGDSSAGPSNTGESSTGSSDFEARKRAFGLVPITTESLAS